MKFTDLFIRRPVLSIVVNLLIVIAGVQAVKSLNVRQYPRSENAATTVTTAYVGANAALVRGFLTTPLERAIAAADGIDYLESSSAQSVSTITAHLRLNYEANKALSEIASKVDAVRGDLPPGAEVPVINIVSVDSQFASAYLSFSSEFLKQNEITDYLTRVVQPRLSAIEGVQRADLLGARTFAMRIWLKADRMAALNVSPSQVRQALSNNNYLAAVGQTKGQLVQVNLTANTDLSTAEEFEQLVVRQSGGATVRLKDIANVQLGAEDYDTAVNFSGQTAVFIGVWALPNANSLDVIKKVRTEMTSLEKELPEQIKGRIAYDGTAYINSAISEVVQTLLETLLIVVIVIFLFLGSLRSSLVPVVAIPVSLIGGIFLIQAFGFTINLLTLLAIVLSVGLVVDDAIVVVENVERHLREGKSPLDAALLSGRELVGPIISMTITLAAVYAPIAFQGGLTGSLFREFALTLAGAVTISGIVALTLSPMMSAYLLHGGDAEKGLAGVINRAFDRFRTGYGRTLDRILQVRGPVYVAWVVVALLAFLMFSMSAKELAPAEDQGIVFGVVNTPANSTLEQVTQSTRQINKDLEGVAETQFTFQITNPGGGFWGDGLKPWDERKRTAGQILGEVSQKVSSVPGVQTFAVLPPALPGGGTFPVEIVLASTAEPSEILRFAQQLSEKAGKSGIFAFPPILDTKIDQPQSEFQIDREKVAELGLNLTTVGQDIGSAVGGNYVNRFSVAGRSYKVIPQLLRSERMNPEQLQDLYVTGPDQKLVALSTIATIKDSVTPRSLNRFQQLNAVKISGVAVHRGRQVPACVRARGGADLPRARRAVQQLPRPVRDPRRLGSIGHVRRPDHDVLEDAEPEHEVLHRRLDHDLERLLPGRPGDARRPRVEERHPHRRVREPAAGAGTLEDRSHPPRRHHAPAAGDDDERRDRLRALPAHARHRSGSGGPQQHRARAGGRNGHRHALHPLLPARHLRPARQGPPRGGQGAGAGSQPGAELTTSRQGTRIGILLG
jgi:multidrug efflux pump